MLITDAGAHPCARYVAHVAVMDYRDGGFSAKSFPTREVIRRGCTNLWRAIAELEEDVRVAMVAQRLASDLGGIPDAEPPRPGVASGAARITRVMFYGDAFLEFLAIADVVTRQFPAALADVPEEVRAHIEGLRQGP